MTPEEFFKSEAGMTDAELEQYKSIMGDAKFQTAAVKLLAARDQATATLAQATKEKTDFENAYQNVYLPELRKTTTDALNAQGEAAKLKAQLDAARQYGVVPDSITPPTPEPRAPGSGNSNIDYSAELKKYNDSAVSALVTMSDLNAESMRLFGKPVENMQSLIDKVGRENQMGRTTNLRQVWESEHNVPAKRAEIAAASSKAHDDEVAAKAIQAYREKNGGDNPSLLSPRISRFASMPSVRPGEKAPWQGDSNLRRNNNTPWREAATQKLASLIQ